MSQRARELAERFEQVAVEFAAEVERLTEARWRAVTPEDGRTVAALARHVAFGYEVEMESFQAMAEGRPARTWTREALDLANAEDAEQYADCDQAETLDLLRRNAAAAAAVVRSLSDEQLARSGIYLEGRPALTVEQWIERILIGHPGMHLPAIRAGAEAARPG